MTTIMLQRNSEFKELYRQKLRWYREVGVLDGNHRRWIPGKPPCLGSLGFNSIGLTEVRAPLMMIAIGYVLSLIILALEMLFTKTQPKLRRFIIRTQFYKKYKSMKKK